MTEQLQDLTDARRSLVQALANVRAEVDENIMVRCSFMAINMIVFDSFLSSLPAKTESRRAFRRRIKRQSAAISEYSQALHDKVTIEALGFGTPKINVCRRSWWRRLWDDLRTSRKTKKGVKA
jgi:hypothetical protein